jgi:transaldolase/glucose-6-phosphate isomerase
MTDAVRALTEPGAGTAVRLPASLHTAVDETMQRAVVERWASRIWERDASLWTTDEDVAHSIRNRLGWLDAPMHFQEQVEELTGFASGIVEAGFTGAVVCGMGGSSLAPEVLAHAFAHSAHGVPVAVLDSTDPDAVRAVDARNAGGQPLYLVATKSGTTTETLSFLEYFWEETRHRVGRVPLAEIGDSFVAITDPEESLRAIPHSDVVREIFLNPPDIGGRYSALTYVGLVPAALLGLDLEELLADGEMMAERCQVDDGRNPGLLLGVTLGALARAGRDKVTLVLEPQLGGFGAWTEQLIAESTGKRGVGIVPVDGEALGPPSVYGADRVFVRLGRDTATDWRGTTDAALDALAEAGHPVVDVTLQGGEWLGGEFFRWEFATAVAGIAIDVNPFDEPNVTESKENTRAVLERFHHDGALPAETPLAAEGRLRLIGDAALRLTVDSADIRSELRRHLDRARPNGYHAIGAFIAPTEGRTALLRQIQQLLRDRTQRATTLGYGPRYLHSTGQLHKGGARLGCFLQLVSGHPHDLPIPGRHETFGTLIDAQALGDFASLQAHELPVLRVHLSDDPDAGLVELQAALEAALN